jgi:FkbM family methyltransferase
LDKRIAAIEILNFNFYEKKDSEMIFNLLEKDYIIFDIGANIGWYSLNIAQQFPESQIFAFEPIPATFNLLKRNVELNNYHNISIYNWGFSDQNQEIIFYLHQDTSVSASAVNLYEGKDFAQVICQVKKLDDYAEQIKPKIDFIKCDVEGAELFVYQGGIETIKRNKPIIFTEMLRKWSAKFNYHPNEIIKFFGALGYRCFTVNETNLWEFFIMDDYTVETNFFFLHSVNHAEKIAQFIAR